MGHRWWRKNKFHDGIVFHGEEIFVTPLVVAAADFTENREFYIPHFYLTPA